MSYSRNRRISEEIKKVVSMLIMNGLKDPRVSSLTTVTHVDTTNDLRYTTIYISSLDSKQNINDTILGLESAKGYIRKEIGKTLKLRYTPEPLFKVDSSLEHGMHINDIISGLNKRDDDEE
ncbi:MAG: 30S ribosome-binding factor RbfA [Firmicutes bacterium]|jgi:ribosome-binding factor A|nr:30S ribosome-binding factor RbfA [Bacillota bacterium]